jgi:hypothetical protein
LLPPPAIECFAGAGGSVQFADRGRTFGAYLLAGPKASVSVVSQARRVLDTLHVEPAAATLLERNGISLAVPWGWDGRVLFRDAAGASHVQFQVANFELPANEGLEPPQELPPGEEDPIKAMGASDVLVMVVTDEPGGVPAPDPITLADLRFLLPGALRVPHAHWLAEGSFCRGARCFGIQVDFGGRSPAPTLREQVNEVLSSLHVDQIPASTDPPAPDAGPANAGCCQKGHTVSFLCCQEKDSFTKD